MRWTLAVIIIALVACAAWWLDPFESPKAVQDLVSTLQQEKVVAELSIRQKQIVDMLIERNKLLVSLTTLLMGGTVGLLLTRLKDAPLAISRPAWLTLILSWMALAVSILGGYKHYESLALMLDYQFFVPLHAYFVLWSTVQFWSFLVGMVFSVMFLVQIGLTPQSLGAQARTL